MEGRSQSISMQFIAKEVGSRCENIERLTMNSTRTGGSDLRDEEGEGDCWMGGVYGGVSMPSRPWMGADVEGATWKSEAMTYSQNSARSVEERNNDVISMARSDDQKVRDLDKDHDRAR